MDGKPPKPGVIEKARIASGESYDSLSAKSGIPRTTLQRKLAQEDDFKVRELRKLAPILNGDLAEWVRALGAADEAAA